MTTQPAAPSRPRPRIQPPPAPVTGNAHQSQIVVKAEKRPGYCKVSELPYCLEPVAIAPAIGWCEELKFAVDYLMNQGEKGEPWDATTWLDIRAHMDKCETCQQTQAKIEQMRQGADNERTTD